MIEFLFSNQLKLDHWAGNPYWFLTLFAGIWILPLIFYKKLTLKLKRFLLVGLIYFITLIFRSSI